MQLRHTFTKRPQRYRLAGVSGLSFCLFKQRNVYALPLNSPYAIAETRKSSGFVNFGLSNNVRLTPRLDLTGDLLLNFNLRHPSNYYLPIAPGGSLALGLNYNL